MAVRNLQDMGVKLQEIMMRLVTNEELVKLLYYADKDPLSHENLTMEEKKAEVFHKLIKIIPRVGPKDTAQSIIAVRVVKAQKDPENEEFKEITIAIESFVPLEQWLIKGDNLRPFSIMGEIENSLNRKRVAGLGEIISLGFELSFLTDEISCYQQIFTVIAYD